MISAERFWQSRERSATLLAFHLPLPQIGRTSGAWRYLCLDATYLKVRQGGLIVSVVAMIVVAVDTKGKRESIGLHLARPTPSPFRWILMPPFTTGALWPEVIHSSLGCEMKLSGLFAIGDHLKVVENG